MNCTSMPAKRIKTPHHLTGAAAAELAGNRSNNLIIGFNKADVKMKKTERMGFEPMNRLLERLPDFQSGALNHSATAPTRALDAVARATACGGQRDATEQLEFRPNATHGNLTTPLDG